MSTSIPETLTPQVIVNTQAEPVAPSKFDPKSLTGQQDLTVRFQGSNQGRVGGLLGLRLESPRP